jgi:opacity protein-like surface antigen
MLFATIAPGAHAQTASTVDWQHGTTLSGFVGAASTARDTGGAAGLSLGWEVTPRFGVEGRGIWLLSGDTEDAFAATLAARVAIPPGRPVVPFASAGVGLYRATFDAIGGTVPDFYRRRVTSPGSGRQTFTDFAVSFGGGVDFFLTRHVAVRPEVNVLLATTRVDLRATTVYGAQLAYHFESHPITPQRRE